MSDCDNHEKPGIPPHESHSEQIRTARYNGWLSGYCAATGRSFAFGMTKNETVMVNANEGFESGYEFGKENSVNGLIEFILHQRMHTFCPDCAAARNRLEGGRRVSPEVAASICRPR